MFHYAKQVLLLWNITVVKANTILANTLSLAWMLCGAFLYNTDTFLCGGANPFINSFTYSLYNYSSTSMIWSLHLPLDWQ